MSFIVFKKWSIIHFICKIILNACSWQRQCFEILTGPIIWKKKISKNLAFTSFALPDGSFRARLIQWHARQQARKQQLMEKTLKIPIAPGCTVQHSRKALVWTQLISAGLVPHQQDPGSSSWLGPIFLSVSEGAYQLRCVTLQGQVLPGIKWRLMKAQSLQESSEALLQAAVLLTWQRAGCGCTNTSCWTTDASANCQVQFLSICGALHLQSP